MKPLRYKLRGSIREVYIAAAGAEYGVQVRLVVAVEHRPGQEDRGERVVRIGGKLGKSGVAQPSRFGSGRIGGIERGSAHKMGRFDREGAAECTRRTKGKITDLGNVLRNGKICWSSSKRGVERIVSDGQQTSGQRQD